MKMPFFAMKGLDDQLPYSSYHSDGDRLHLDVNLNESADVVNQMIFKKFSFNNSFYCSFVLNENAFFNHEAGA